MARHEPAPGVPRKTPGVPLDGTLLTERATGDWVIAGGARFHIPDAATRLRVFSGRVGIGLWNGATDVIPTTPADGTLLREDNGAIWVIFGGARFHVPDSPTLVRLFPRTPVFQLWDGALDGLGTVPKDGTLLKEESNGQVLVMLGGQRHRARFFSVSDVRVLWDGALAAIPEGEPAGLIRPVHPRPERR
jgi:hypothetical protein